MTQRRIPTLVLTLLLPLGLAACKQDAPEVAPADTAASGPVQASAPDAAETQAAEAAIVQLMSTEGPPPVEGKDYETIPNGQPFAPVPGKVEVVEVFNHVCPACAGFQPLVSAWKAKLPADVNFVYVPALFGGPFDTYARTFYAAQALGMEDKSHDALYRAIHVDRTLKGERGRDTPQDIARFYQAYGADPAQFVETMGSFAVEGKLNQAKQFAQRSGVQGTPTLIVAGKYRITADSRDAQVRVANQLIERERQAMGGAAAPATDAAPAGATAPAAAGDTPAADAAAPAGDAGSQ